MLHAIFGLLACVFCNVNLSDMLRQKNMFWNIVPTKWNINLKQNELMFD